MHAMSPWASPAVGSILLGGICDRQALSVGWHIGGYGCGVARVAKPLLERFEEDTADERFVLDTIATAGQPPHPNPPPRDDLRGSGLSMSRSASDWLAADSVAQAIGNFRPLGFGAAYKVIDALVELVMRMNREPCPRAAGRSPKSSHT
jgi:hypothetical protein